MGLFGDLFGFVSGAGYGGAGAQNAHLAELAIMKTSDSEKKRIAEKVISMGVQAAKSSGATRTDEQYCDHFNRHERLCQLNVIALALAQLDINTVKGELWMQVRNPYTLNIDSTDLKVNADYLFKKHNLRVSIGTERIDIRKWVNNNNDNNIYINENTNNIEFVLVNNRTHINVNGAILSVLLLSAKKSGWKGGSNLFDKNGYILNLPTQKTCISKNDAINLGTILKNSMINTNAAYSPEILEVINICNFFTEGSFDIVCVS